MATHYCCQLSPDGAARPASPLVPSGPSGVSTDSACHPGEDTRGDPVTGVPGSDMTSMTAPRGCRLLGEGSEGPEGGLEGRASRELLPTAKWPREFRRCRVRVARSTNLLAFMLTDTTLGMEVSLN